MRYRRACPPSPHLISKFDARLSLPGKPRQEAHPAANRRLDRARRRGSDRLDNHPNTEPPMHLLTRLGTAAGAAAFIAAAAVAQTPVPKLDKVSMRYSYVATGAVTVWAYGIERNFFREQGIELELREGKGSALTAQTVAAGTDDFGVDIDSGTFLGLAAKGLPARAVLSN